MTIKSVDPFGTYQAFKKDRDDAFEQFFNKCEKLKEVKFNSKNFDEMKVFYTPTQKASVTARFDKIAEDFIEANTKMKNASFKPISVNATYIVSQAKEMLNEQKNNVIAEMTDSYSKENNSKWRDLGLEDWLNKKISKISFSEKQGTVTDVMNIVADFWPACTTKWAKKNGLEKFTPNKELTNLMEKNFKEIKQKISDKLNYIDCFTFAISYLKLEDNLKADLLNFYFRSLKEEFSSDNFCLVSTPRKNDLIIYLDSENKPIHFGVFLNSTQIISKIGQLSIFKQNLEDEKDGVSYLIARITA